MFGFIYITQNLVNGKKYLGFCSYKKGNWKTYLGSGKVLRRAIKKYGSENFSRTIIHESMTKEELSQKEIEFIQEFNCVESRDWYNIASGGYATRGFSGKKHSAETKSKMRQSYKRELTEEGRQRLSEASRKRIAKARESIGDITGANHPRARSVTIDGVTYPTTIEASKATGMSLYHVRKHLET